MGSIILPLIPYILPLIHYNTHLFICMKIIQYVDVSL